MITIEEMYLRNAISGNISPQYEKVVEFPLQAHEIALVLMHHMGIMKKTDINATPNYAKST